MWTYIFVSMVAESSFLFSFCMWLYSRTTRWNESKLSWGRMYMSMVVESQFLYMWSFRQNVLGIERVNVDDFFHTDRFFTSTRSSTFGRGWLNPEFCLLSHVTYSSLKVSHNNLQMLSIYLYLKSMEPLSSGAYANKVRYAQPIAIKSAKVRGGLSSCTSTRGLILI